MKIKLTYAVKTVCLISCTFLAYWLIKDFNFDTLHTLPLRSTTLMKRNSNIKLDRINNLLQNKEDRKEQKDQDNLNCEKVHSLSCVEPYYSRLHHVKKQCEKKKQANYKLHSTHYKFSDKLKLVMCETPKAASRTMQEALFKMDSSYANSKSKKCDGIGNKCFLEISEDEAWFRVKNYTSFLITRHPFERLVSGYFAKFVINKETFFRERYGKEAALKQARQYLHGIEPGSKLLDMSTEDVKSLQNFTSLSSNQQTDVLKYIEVMKTGRISFPQFIKFLINYFEEGRVKEMDRHWLPQVLLCQPCAFNYSYIMKFDNIDSDSNRLFDYLEQHSLSSPLPEGVRIMKRSGYVKRKNVSEKSFQEVPEDHVHKIRLIYEDDFRLFNYDPFLYHGY